MTLVRAIPSSVLVEGKLIDVAPVTFLHKSSVYLPPQVM
jgi:hypothetical protein